MGKVKQDVTGYQRGDGSKVGSYNRVIEEKDGLPQVDPSVVEAASGRSSDLEQRRADIDAQRLGERYDADGYNEEGWSRWGRNRDTGTAFDASGYDREGRDFAGRDRNGYNREGRDWAGQDRNGYDREGFNRDGINRETGTKYDREGFNREGRDKDGFNRRASDPALQQRADLTPLARVGVPTGLLGGVGEEINEFFARNPDGVLLKKDFVPQLGSSYKAKSHGKTPKWWTERSEDFDAIRDDYLVRKGRGWGLPKRSLG